MLMDGFSYMFIGMTVVFSFLVILVISMQIMSSVILRFFPEKEEDVEVPSANRDKDIIAVIAAAVKHYESAGA
jgi:oxaloacetate decarboxylase (Na+ extruding) subunit gamma